MPFFKDMIDILEELGWNLHDVVAEGAYSQFELDFHYTHVLEMADRLVFLRILLKEVAKRHGWFITFMPKPTVGDWRSGAHINFSLQSVDRPGANLFGAGDSGWTDTALHAVGGLISHSEALTALTCPTVNSYNGLVPRVGGLEGGTVTWAPTNITYGHNNRSAQFRLPQSRYCIENRAADMCMNIYLALAMTQAAAIEGITKQVDPGPPTDRDLYAMTDEEFSRTRNSQASAKLVVGRRVPWPGCARGVGYGACHAEFLHQLQGRRVGAVQPGRHRLGGQGVSQTVLMRRGAGLGYGLQDVRTW